MAIKVLKQGIKDEDKKYIEECRGCNSTIEFLKSDTVLVPDARDGDYLRIDCPVCDNTLIVNPRNFIK